MSKFLGILLLVLTSWAPVQAATIVTDSTGTKVTNILNLDVEGTFLDVMFDYVDGRVNPITEVTCGSDVTVYCDMFVDNEPGAISATQAMANALNFYNDNQPPQKVTGIFDQSASNPADPGNEIDALVIYDFPNGLVDFSAYTLKRNYDGVEVFWFNLGDGDFNDAVFSEFARFRPAAQVPLPPAVLMFASGLGLLGWTSRRRKKRGVLDK
jgi:hypothetical protein